MMVACSLGLLHVCGAAVCERRGRPTLSVEGGRWAGPTMYAQHRKCGGIAAGAALLLLLGYSAVYCHHSCPRTPRLEHALLRL